MPLANAVWGSRGGFVDLPTGDYLLTFSGPSAKCVAAGSGFTSGYLSATPVVAPPDPTGRSVTVLVPVTDGYLTGPVAVSCTSAEGGDRQCVGPVKTREVEWSAARPGVTPSGRGRGALGNGWESTAASASVHRHPEEARMKLSVTLELDESGMVVAECPAIPGCVSQGATEEEALSNIREAILGCLETRAAAGMPLTVRTVDLDIAVA
jgi:predicted RNase H-like HicB family nuclease